MNKMLNKLKALKEKVDSLTHDEIADLYLEARGSESRKSFSGRFENYLIVSSDQQKQTPGGFLESTYVVKEKEASAAADSYEPVAQAA